MKIGIVGLGFMGAMHLDAYGQIPEVRVAAVCAGSRGQLESTPGAVRGNIQRQKADFDFSGVRRYAHWQELVSDAGLDAVDVCLPTDLHAEVATAALEAGKHVLCEKPMALSTDDCARMMDAASRSRRILMIGQVLRFWPEYMYLRDEAESGALGRVRYAKFARSSGIPDWSRWLTDEARSGGAVVDLLVHDIDQILLLAGMPVRVSARPKGEVDTISAELVYEEGLQVALEGGWLPAGAPLTMTFDVGGERGRLELTTEGLWKTDAGGRRERVRMEGGDGYAAELLYFVECCREGQEPARCLPQESAAALKLALALKEARAMNGQERECLV